ncbi:MAG: aspartate/glutamate racemase family protein [Desulfobacterales bacterium]|nr:aspartate/glutamate racemase family protein [Desulfobacterales bacterium]
MHQNRDFGITSIRGRNVHCSGMGLGIILLDETYPGFPGDVRNPSAFPYPIQYEVAQGLDIKKLIHDKDKDQHLDTILTAALRLQKMGCRAIAAECGYFAYFQKEVAARLDIPVFMSSLLQVSWAQSIINPDHVVGILMSSKDSLLEKHLIGAGVHLGTNYVVGDAMDDGKCPEFHNLWTEGLRPETPQADYQLAEQDFLRAATAFYEKYPNMGAMVLECTGFQPFARAVQRIINIPIFSWGTLMDFAHTVTVHRDYYGYL